MSGAHAPKYSEDQKQRVIQIVLEEHRTYIEAASETGLSHATVKGIIGAYKRLQAPNGKMLPEGGPLAQVADYTARLSLMVHREIARLEVKSEGSNPPKAEDLEKALKVVKELNALAKAHPGKTAEEDGPKGKLAELVGDLPDADAA